MIKNPIELADEEDLYLRVFHTRDFNDYDPLSGGKFLRPSDRRGDEMAPVWASQITNVPLDKIEEPMFLRVLDEWSRGYRHGTEDVPRRVAVSSIRSILPYMALVDLNVADGEPRYRIFGSSLTRVLGQQAQGRNLRDIYHPKIFSEIKGTFTAACLLRQPIFTINEFRIVWKTFGYRRLVLPLAVRGGAIGRMIVLIQPLNAKMQDAAEWKDLFVEPKTAVADVVTETMWTVQLQMAD